MQINEQYLTDVCTQLLTEQIHVYILDIFSGVL